MSRRLWLRNRQKMRRVNLAEFRRITRYVLARLLPAQPFELSVCLVDRDEITRLNETFLHHGGSTDVITFNFADPPESALLHGEIVICLEEAVTQAGRFRTSWPLELVRYVVHGVLHLCGYDDRRRAAREKMKREEDRLVRELAGHFCFERLAASK